MLRSTIVKRTVPCHPVIPGNFSHRGFLYRNSDQNFYSRIAPMSKTQLTWTEQYRNVVLNGTQLNVVVFWVTPALFAFYFYTTGYGSGYWEEVMSESHEEISKSSRSRRNIQVQQIFDGHKEVYASLLAEVEMPEVLRPPEGSNYRNDLLDA